MRKMISMTGFLALALAAMSAQAAAVTVVNSGFEASWSAVSTQGADGSVVFNYQPTGANMGWTFGSDTGVVNPQTSQVAAAEGAQYAFLQMESGFLSQTFTVAQAGQGDLSFLFGLRPNYAPGQQLEVYLDNTLLSTFSMKPSASLNWQTAGMTLNFLSAGTHTLAFKGTGIPGGGDTTVFLDQVAVNVNVSAVPEPSSALMLSLGLGGLLLARRRQA